MKKLKVLTVIVLLCCVEIGCSLMKNTPNQIAKSAVNTVKNCQRYRVNANLDLQMEIGGQPVSCEEKSELTYVKSPFEFYLKNSKVDVKGEKYDSAVYFNYDKNANAIYQMDQDGQWSKKKYSNKQLDSMNESYLVPIELQTYLKSGIAFKKVKSDQKGIICLKADLKGENAFPVLESSGVLQQLKIGKLDQDELKDIEGIKVTAYIEKKTGNLSKLCVDMTQAFQKIVDQMFNKKEQLYQITTCKLEWNHCEFDEKTITVPKGITEIAK